MVFRASEKHWSCYCLHTVVSCLPFYRARSPVHIYCLHFTFGGIVGCFLGGRVSILLMCSVSVTLLTEQLLNFVIIIIEPVLVFTRVWPR